MGGLWENMAHILPHGCFEKKPLNHRSHRWHRFTNLMFSIICKIGGICGGNKEIFRQEHAEFTCDVCLICCISDMRREVNRVFRHALRNAMAFLIMIFSGRPYRAWMVLDAFSPRVSLRCTRGYGLSALRASEIQNPQSAIGNPPSPSLRRTSPQSPFAKAPADKSELQNPKSAIQNPKTCHLASDVAAQSSGRCAGRNNNGNTRTRERDAFAAGCPREE